MISERFIIKKQNIVLLIKILKNLCNIIIDNIYRYTRKFLFLKNNIALYILIVLINIK